MRIQDIVPLASLFTAVSAHSIFVQLGTNPVSYAVRTPTYDGPINDVTTKDIACNGGPNPTQSSKDLINVKAGETVKATWRHTLDSTPASDSIYVIDPSHHGPVMAYMKKVDDATTDVGYGPGWFKISEQGYNPTTKTWAVDDLIANKGIQDIQIPSCIANGQYLLRAELIALHGAGSNLGAQFYMECAQINVTGGTGTANPATVSFPGAYAQNDPGILLSIYSPITEYKIPGPRPMTCGAASAPAASSAAPAAPSTLSTVVKSVASSTVVSSSAAASSAIPTPAVPAKGTVPLYGQCGGTGWTGATSCASGSCKANGAYYSQCMP